MAPKVLLGKYLRLYLRNTIKSTAQKAIDELIKDLIYLSYVGDTIIDVKLEGYISNDKILIKGQTLTLLPIFVRKTIYR